MLDEYGKERSYPVRQAQSKDQDLLGRDRNGPSLPTTRQGIAMPQPEGHRHTGLFSALCEPEDTHTGRELMVFWPPALSKPWLESWMKLTSIQFYFLWKVFSIRTNVFRRTFLWHASMTNDKSHLILFKEIRCPTVVCELLSKEHLW